MIDALDLKAMQDHHNNAMPKFSPKGIEQFQPVVFAATSSDKRVIDLVAQFNASDERGKQVLLRLAQVMPKGAL